MNTHNTTLEQLLDIMRRLRDPQTGCAWDVKQSFNTIAPFTVEEAYEVADAIERCDFADLKDELGDLLYQVVFHAQMAAEDGIFDFHDVVQSIVDKMIRRHPHVFGDTVYASEEELKAGWEAIKSQERQAKLALNSQIANNSNETADEERQLPASALDGVAANLPALKRADKLQKRAARVGFDWPDVAPVWHKLDEEIQEVKTAVAAEDIDALEDEMGDLLFTVVNLARHHGVDSEQALMRACTKFNQRFRDVEYQARQQNLELDAQTIEQLDTLWERVKSLSK